MSLNFFKHSLLLLQLQYTANDSTMLSNLWVFQAALLCVWLLTVLVINRRRDGAIPTIRRWPEPFPEFLDRLSYNHDTAQLIEEGYQKVCRFRLLFWRTRLSNVVVQGPTVPGAEDGHGSYRHSLEICGRAACCHERQAGSSDR